MANIKKFDQYVKESYGDMDRYDYENDNSGNEEPMDDEVYPMNDTRPAAGSFEDFQSEVAYAMTIQGEMPNGDAQGIMEAQPDVVERCFDEGMSAEETADMILNGGR